jgi:hypothetical protein
LRDRGQDALPKTPAQSSGLFSSDLDQETVGAGIGTGRGRFASRFNRNGRSIHTVLAYAATTLTATASNWCCQ